MVAALRPAANCLWAAERIGRRWGVVWENCWYHEVFGNVRLNADTALPSWNGDPVDYDAAVGALMDA